MQQTLLTKTRNEPKQPETSQNEPKPAEATPNIAKRPETTQNFKIREIWDFLPAFVFQVLSPNTQIWVFWAKKY